MVTFKLLGSSMPFIFKLFSFCTIYISKMNLKRPNKWRMRVNMFLFPSQNYKNKKVGGPKIWREDVLNVFCTTNFILADISPAIILQQYGLYQWVTSSSSCSWFYRTQTTLQPSLSSTQINYPIGLWLIIWIYSY